MRKKTQKVENSNPGDTDGWPMKGRRARVVRQAEEDPSI